MYEAKFLSLLFESLQSSINNGLIKKDRISWITGFVKATLKYELG
mgnify:CR=1 FL=1